MSTLALRLIHENQEKYTCGEDARTLDLGNCSFKREMPHSVVKELEACIWVETLILSSWWYEYEPSAQTWIRAHSPNHGRNNYLVQLPESLSHLVSLKKLVASRLHIIRDISPLSGLTDLEELYFSTNEIEDLTPIANLKNLKRIYCPYNKIKDLSPLEGLDNITQFNCAYNHIQDLSPILSLMIENDIPIFWKDFIQGTSGIAIKGNPISHPPLGVVHQGSAGILRWMSEQKRSGTTKIREAKLLLVGQGESGKTTLRRKLLNVNNALPERDPATQGIEIESLKFQDTKGEEFHLNIWDFGGQSIQRYAHQFFLTGSSVYALLCNTREENPNFQYWLNIIELLGGESPILVVQNKKQGYFEPIRNEASIRQRFKNVHNYFFAADLSRAAEEPDFFKLRETIYLLSTHLPHIQREYPRSYAAIRKVLEVKARRKNYISWKEYRIICQNEGMHSEPTMQDFAIAFTYIGVCLWLPKVGLRDYVFLRPKWIIDALFLLIYNKEVSEKKGFLDENDTLSVWSGKAYDGMHDRLLRLLEEFYLCYRLSDVSGRYVIPQLLPAAKEPDRWSEKQVTRLIFRYDFRPEGIVTRLICRLHKLIEKDESATGLVWSDAVVFKLKNNARAFVYELFGEKDIVVEAAGSKSADILERMIEEVDAIHQEAKYANLQVEKLIQCSCPVCKNDKEPYFFEYDYLVELLADHETRERCRKTKHWVSIIDILAQTGPKAERAAKNQNIYGRGSFEDIEDSDDPNQEKKSTLNVFFSYSKHDKTLLDEFIKALNPLIITQKIKYWDDSKIRPGEYWDNSISEALEFADIIFLLLSNDFLNTPYIVNKEITVAMHRHEKGEALIVPVVLRRCLWEKLSLGKLQGIPRKGKTVTEAVNRDVVWYEIVEEIKDLIEQF